MSPATRPEGREAGDGGREHGTETSTPIQETASDGSHTCPISGGKRTINETRNGVVMSTSLEGQKKDEKNKVGEEENLLSVLRQHSHPSPHPSRQANAKTPSSGNPTRTLLLYQQFHHNQNEQQHPQQLEQQRKQNLMDASGGPAGFFVTPRGQQGMFNAPSWRRRASSSSETLAMKSGNPGGGGSDAGRLRCQPLPTMDTFSSNASSFRPNVENNGHDGVDRGSTPGFQRSSGSWWEDYDRDWEKQCAPPALAAGAATSAEEASVRRMESCGSAVRAARQKMRQGEKLSGGHQNLGSSSVGAAGAPRIPAKRRPRHSVYWGRYSSDLFDSSNGNSNNNPDSLGPLANKSETAGNNNGVGRGWGGGFFDTMSGTFCSSNSNSNSGDVSRGKLDTEGDWSFGDFGDDSGRSGDLGGVRRLRGSNLRRVGYRGDSIADSFGGEDNEETAGAGGKRVSAASAPRGGGCAADSASKSMPSLLSVTSSFRGTFRGTVSGGQANKTHAGKVDSFDGDRGSKTVVLPTPHAPPRVDRYPGSPTRRRRRKGAGIGDTDDVTTEDDGETIPLDLCDVREAWKWEDRPQVSRMLNDLADAMVAGGYREQAADLFERSVEVYLAYDGPYGHGGLAEALNDLGYVLWEQCACPAFAGQDVGEHLACALVASAEEVFRLAYVECGDNPGYDHPFAAVCISNLADCASARMAYEDASELLKRALRVRLMSLGPKHVETANTLKKLGGVQHQQGFLDDAEGCYIRALRIYVNALGPDHVDVGSALNLLAVVVGEQGRHIEAENFHRRALFQRQRAGASGPDDLAPMLYNLGLVVGTNARRGPVAGRALGEAESEKLLREALDVYTRGLGPDHPEVADCLDKLAAAVAMNGDLAEAERLHRKALHVFEKTLGDDDPQVAEVLFNLAAVIGAQKGRLHETEVLLTRCLQAQKALHGPDHPEVALVLDRLAEVIRARDASSVCGLNPNSDNSNVSIHHDIHYSGLSGITFGSSGGSGLDIRGTTGGGLASSRRNGPSAIPSSQWWRGVSNGGSLTSRGSSWFDSVPSAYGGVGVQKGGDTGGGSNGADGCIIAGGTGLAAAGGRKDERKEGQPLSATSAAASFSPADAAAPRGAASSATTATAISTTDPAAVGVVSTNVAATCTKVAIFTSDPAAGITYTNAGGAPRKDQHDGGMNGEIQDGIRRGDDGSKGVSNGGRSGKRFARECGGSETGSCFDARSSRAGSSNRRNKASLHGGDSSDSSDSSPYASVDARSRLSSSTRRQHERRLRKQRQQKQQQQQCRRQRLRQPVEVFVTPTSKPTHNGRGESRDDASRTLATTQAKAASYPTRVDSRSYSRRRGQRSVGGVAPGMSIFSSPVTASKGTTYRSSSLSTSGDDYYDTSSSTSSESDSDVTGRSEEFQSSSEASSSGSGDDRCYSDSNSMIGRSTVGGTPTSHTSASVYARTSKSSATGLGSPSEVGNCWSDGVFESTTDSTPPLRARRAKAVAAAAAAQATNNLPAIPLPIPAFATNSDRRKVILQTALAEGAAGGGTARDGGRLEKDLGEMAISLLNRGSSMTQKVRNGSPHLVRRDRARMTRSEAKDGMEGRNIVYARDQAQAPHPKPSVSDARTEERGTEGNVLYPSLSQLESEMPPVGARRDGSHRGTTMPWGSNFVYGHELSENPSSSSSSESLSMYDGFDSEPERTAPRERVADIGGGKVRVNDGVKSGVEVRKADIRALGNGSAPKTEREEIVVTPKESGEGLGKEREGVCGTGVSEEGGGEIRGRAGKKKRGKGKGVGKALKAAAAAIAGRLETNKKRNKSNRSLDASEVVGTGGVVDTGDSEGLFLPPNRNPHAASIQTLRPRVQPEGETEDPEKRSKNQDQNRGRRYRSHLAAAAPSSAAPSGVWNPARRRWRGLGGGGRSRSRQRDRREVAEVVRVGAPTVQVAESEAEGLFDSAVGGKGCAPSPTLLGCVV